MIIGRKAVIVYGELRLIKDVDITLLAQPNKLTKMTKVGKDLALEVLVEDVEDFAIQHACSYPVKFSSAEDLIHPKTCF